MAIKKLKTYRFYVKRRHKETHKIIEKQFEVVAYGIKEAKELFEIAIEHDPMHKNWKIIEITAIRRVPNNKWPNYTFDYYKTLTEMKKKAKRRNENVER